MMELTLDSDELGKRRCAYDYWTCDGMVVCECAVWAKMFVLGCCCGLCSGHGRLSK
jgi:hypothetical protein